MYEIKNWHETWNGVFPEKKNLAADWFRMVGNIEEAQTSNKKKTTEEIPGLIKPP